MIVGVFTELGSPGGIQRVCRHAAAVLAELARAGGEELVLLSLNEAVGVHEVPVPGGTVRVHGHGRSKARLTAAALRRFSAARLAYLAHPGLAPLALAHRALRPGGACWVAAYGLEVWEPLSWLDRQGMRRATGLTAISRSTARALHAAQGVDPARVQLVPCALDPELSDRPAGDTAELDGLPAGPLLLTVSRLATADRYKGIDTVIRALPAVAARVPAVQWVVAGDGDDRPRLEALAREAGVAGRAHFLGRVSEAVLAECYRRADVFVMPSQAEGFGIVFLEAMQQGVPVVAADSGGTPEVVADGETGLLVPYGDHAALADRLVRLLEDAPLRAAMGEAGRRRVTENFTFEHLRDRLAEVLHGGGAPPRGAPAGALAAGPVRAP
jgi:phosphatidylinositol alpha-1,6-mannosyltransferase